MSKILNIKGIVICLAIIAILINPCVIKKSFFLLANVEAANPLNSISNQLNNCQITQVVSTKKEGNQNQSLKKINNLTNSSIDSHLVSKINHAVVETQNNSPPKYILYQSLKIHQS